MPCAENEVIWLAPLWPELHPASAKANAERRGDSEAESVRARSFVKFSWQAPCSNGFAKLFEREQIRSERLTVGKLRGAIAALGVEKIEQARGAALIGILADVAILLRFVEIARAVKLNDLFVRVQAFVRVFARPSAPARLRLSAAPAPG